MNEPKPTRPWWNRKRFGAALAAAAFSAVLAVPLLLGPVIYAAQRRWIGLTTLNGLYRPVISYVPGPVRPAYDAYLAWWVDLGMRHDAAMRMRRTVGNR
jgi:hypothetical protein